MHILVRRARTYAISDRPNPLPDATYDALQGAWLAKNTGRLLVREPIADRPRTKKNDVETGEDQKGE